MTQQELPTFESQETPQEAPVPPKKPKPKPTRKNKKRKVRPVEPPSNAFPKRRPRKQRVAKPAVAKPHAGGRYNQEVYRAIAVMLGLSDTERAAVLEIVQGLTDGRAD